MNYLPLDVEKSTFNSLLCVPYFACNYTFSVFIFNLVSIYLKAEVTVLRRVACLGNLFIRLTKFSSRFLRVTTLFSFKNSTEPEGLYRTERYWIAVNVFEFTEVYWCSEFWDVVAFLSRHVLAITIIGIEMWNRTRLCDL